MFKKVDLTKLDEGQKAFVSQVEEGVKDYVDGQLKNLPTKDEMAKEFASVKASLEASRKENKQRSIYKQVQAVLVEKGVMSEDGRVDIAKMRELKNIGGVIDLKAAGLVSETGNVNTTAYAAVEPEIDRYPRAFSHLRDISSVGEITSPTLIIPEYNSKEGDAEWTPEGGLKPLLDATLSQRTITAGKVAVAYKTTEELAADFPAFFAEMRAEAIDKVGMKEAYGVLFGNGTGGQIVGVAGAMPAYTMTGHVVEQANYFDAIYAAIIQTEANTEFNYKANGVLLNAADYATMMSTKSTSGVPLYEQYKPFFEGVSIYRENAGIIPQGTFIVGDFSHLNIRDLQALTWETGYADDDFLKNCITVRVEKRLMAYIKNQHKYAFVKDTFANVLGAITPTP